MSSNNQPYRNPNQAAVAQLRSRVEHATTAAAADDDEKATTMVEAKYM